MRSLLRRRVSRAEGRRLPLMASFGVVSLLLTIVLGGVLGIQIQRLVAMRSVSVLTKTTQSAIALTLNTLVSNESYGRDGASCDGNTPPVFLILSAVLGLIAAGWPARRASKLDILAAIAAE